MAAGATVDSAIGFTDGGLLTGLGADIGKKAVSYTHLRAHET